MLGKYEVAVNPASEFLSLFPMSNPRPTLSTVKTLFWLVKQHWIPVLLILPSNAIRAMCF